MNVLLYEFEGERLRSSPDRAVLDAPTAPTYVLVEVRSGDTTAAVERYAAWLADGLPLDRAHPRYWQWRAESVRYLVTVIDGPLPPTGVAEVDLDDYGSVWVRAGRSMAEGLLFVPHHHYPISPWCPVHGRSFRLLRGHAELRSQPRFRPTASWR